MVSLFFSRSVDEQERPFALGMQFVLLRTLGMLLTNYTTLLYGFAVLLVAMNHFMLLCIESTLTVKKAHMV